MDFGLQIIMFSDLECDYINPIDLCNKLNQVRLTWNDLRVTLSDTRPLSSFSRKTSPMHSSRHSSSSRVNGPRSSSTFHWYSTMLTSVYPSCSLRVSCSGLMRLCRSTCAYGNPSNLFRRIRKKSHMYDATEIFRTLGGHKKETFFKLGFYLLSFFYYLYRCVLCLYSRGVTLTLVHLILG